VARQNREFVTAEPRNQITLAYGALQAQSDVDEHLIARPMAVHFVDALEIVEIQEEHRVCAVAARRRGEGSCQLLVETAAVWQPCQGVLKGKLARAMQLNPMTPIIDAYRACLLLDRTPSAALAVAAAVSITDTVPGSREKALLTYARVPSGLSAMPFEPGPTPPSTVATS
jgi:hypothetical protein